MGNGNTLLQNKFMHWLLVDPEHGVIRFATDAERPAIEAVAALHLRAIHGEQVLDEEWAAAWAAARAAASAAAINAQRDKLLELIAE